MQNDATPLKQHHLTSTHRSVVTFLKKIQRETETAARCAFFRHHEQTPKMHHFKAVLSSNIEMRNLKI